MPNSSRFPTWLIGGVVAWLAYAITLSALHLILLKQWGVAYTIQIYNLSSSGPFSFLHGILVVMISPGFFLLETLSFLHIHISWVDAAIYNWGKMTFLSSLPAFIIGALVSSRDGRVKLLGTIIGLLLLGGSLMFVLDRLLSQ